MTYNVAMVRSLELEQEMECERDTAKLSPFAMSTTLETALTPPPHGTTDWPEALGAWQDDPGP